MVSNDMSAIIRIIEENGKPIFYSRRIKLLSLAFAKKCSNSSIHSENLSNSVLAKAICKHSIQQLAK